MEQSTGAVSRPQRWGAKLPSPSPVSCALRRGGVVAVLLAAAAALSACPGGLRRPESPQLVVSGTVTEGGLDARGDPVEGARVALVRAGSGEVLADNVTSSTGGYRLAASVDAGARVFLVVRAKGHAPAVRAMTAGPYAELTLSLALEPLAALDCTDQVCASGTGDLRWVQPPPGAFASARAFDLPAEQPVVADAPAPRQQVLALAYVSLDAGPVLDEDGGLPVDDAGVPLPQWDGGLVGELALRLPLPAWRLVEDVVPDSGVVEVAAARFDPATATWTALGPAPLSTEAGLPVPESALDALRRVELSGGAVATLPLVAEGYVGVVAPPALGCIEGTLDADGQPGRGAAVMVDGRELATGDAKGAFCVAAPVADAPVAAGAQYGGILFTLPALAAPASSGACGGSCAKAGVVKVQPEKTVQVAACNVKGTVTDSLGQPVTDAVVAGFDEGLTGNAFAALCGRLGTRCRLTVATAADGRFDLVLPVQANLYLGARATIDRGASGESARFGAMRVPSCPTGEVMLKLSRGRDLLDVTATFTGDTISWSPPRAAARLFVLDAAGAPKWELESVAGLTPPLTFGQAPAGAAVVTAPTGAAAAGDEVTVVLEGTGRDGVQYLGTASATRP